MNMFDEITKEKRDLPKINSITKEVNKYEYNFYQKFGVVIFLIAFVVGILLGNLFSTCGATSSFYSTQCVTRQFNFSLLLAIWFSGLMMGLFFFALGHIIYLLEEISVKLKK